jgi:hypothetical protein
VQWHEPGSGEMEATAHVIDVSLEGIAVRCSHRIPVARAVALNDGHTDFSGAVRHCTEDGQDFRIGIEIRRAESAPENGPHLS